MKLSIVATLYQSASYINAFHERASASAKRMVGDDYEIVLVNDGSPDNSLDLAVKLTEHDPHVVVVDLSRNFGHHKAMMTGLAHAKGEQVFLIDSDLEEEPEWLGAFAQQMKQDCCDVVYGVQECRKGSWFERLSGKWFYILFKTLTGIALPENLVTARLMTRRYVNALVRHQEREVLIAGLWHITGFDQRFQVVKKHNTSETTYTFNRKMSLLINSVTSFSNTPLVSIFYIGATISLFALAYSAYLVTNWLFLAKPLSGWTSVMASIWLLGGMVISFIGVVGIYLSKIFSETKQRPYTIVRQIYAQQQE
ncbi:glycosyltransferase family 2 protein [Chitinibacter tainanensis]|uniref:glycosyltransferase family 2 protein n=1 Tax=Chitinibacter tainanensis TaxID=230667 RepID=UPI000419D26A|nr:glycosyltransferase family 2 protein [Chitinibacter tainanensis]